jgi:outer membrane lipoprotein-sorting protein
MKRNVWFALSLILALSLVLSGCGKKITAEEIVAKVQETVKSTQDAHAVVTASVDAQGMSLSAKAEVWEKSPNKVRVQVLEASEPDLVGTLLVSDGQQAWYYEPASNRVEVGAAGAIDTPLPQQMLTSLQEIIQQVLDASNVELVGEETLVGRETYKLTLSPKEGAGQDQAILPGNGTATLWVDKEQWYVLKATYEASAFGQGVMEVQSFELNPGLADDLFRFETPEGAEVEVVKIETPEPLTLDEAKAQAGFPLLVPDYVPEGATLVAVFKVGDRITLRYDQPPQNTFTIMQGLTTPDETPAGEPSRQITVRGHDATLITDEAESNTFLSWLENGVIVVIAGHLGPDETVKVAESLR